MIRVLPAVLAALVALPAAAQLGEPDYPPLDAGRRAAIVDSLTAAIDTVYVFPDVAGRMTADIRRRLAAGEYDSVKDPREYAERLTTDLRAVCHDLHLRVGIQPPPTAAEGEDPAAARARNDEAARRANYGFTKVERLAGNVGYLKLDAFSGNPASGPTAVAAMTFLGGSDALIIDLRQNGGGSPAMIQLLSTYLLGEPTHLNSFYIRANDSTRQFWSLPWVPGPRLPEIPVYVLTSAQTFSAAEEFTYNLKNLERATIVGETTGGGAHPVEGHLFDFGAYRVLLSLPFGRAVNPITGTNWEGTGIAPHLSCPAQQALDTAYRHALDALAAACDDPARRFSLLWARDGLAARLAPVTLTREELAPFTGRFGPRVVRFDGDGLVYQRGENPPLHLVPLGGDTFLVAELDYFRVRFERDTRSEVTRLVGLYDDGHVDANDRDR